MPMAKQRDWMDWVNTGATVLQTAQTAEIRGHLASLATTELQREQRATFLRLCREFLIEMDGKIDDLTASSGDSPKATYAAGRMLQQRFERQKFTPSLFDDWGDIDRAKAALKKLNNVLGETGNRVGDSFKSEVTACLDIPERSRELDELISLVEARDNLTTLEDELKKAEQEFAKLPMPLGIIVIQIVGGILIATGAAIACFDFGGLSVIRFASGDRIVLWPFVALLGVVLCFNAKQPGWGVSANSEYDQFSKRLKEQRDAFTKEKEGVIASGPRLSELSREFSGESSSTELTKLRTKLQQRLDALFTSELS
jgi:hypothetical protein